MSLYLHLISLAVMGDSRLQRLIWCGTMSGQRRSRASRDGISSPCSRSWRAAWRSVVRVLLPRQASADTLLMLAAAIIAEHA